MLRRLFASALVIGSAIALSTTDVQAQSVNVPFGGTVASGCTFGEPTAGTLIPTPSARPTSLSTTSEGGSQGSVSFNCGASANIIIASPFQTSGPTFAPTNCTADLSISNGGGINATFGSCNGDTSRFPVPIDGTGTLLVGMSVSNPGGIPSGTYGYNVTLTIVP